jgi:hypothetical protein
MVTPYLRIAKIMLFLEMGNELYRVIEVWCKIIDKDRS